MKGTLMKKIFLILLSLFVFTIDSFASGIGDVSSAPCDNATLNKYTGTANVEINWEPNTIGLKWFNGDEQIAGQTSCTYNGTITVPPAPTKPGYTFNGWKVIPVPGGCKRIEYLESTGGQYIDTGYSAPNGFKAQIGFFISSFLYMYIMGSHNLNEPYGRNYLHIPTSNRIEVGAGDYYLSSYLVQENTKYDVEFSTVKNNVFLTGDNVAGPMGEGDITRSLYTLYLFALNRGDFASSKFYGRIYYVKIYDENGTMVRDFIPILDKNNVPCMWDKITGQFFYNAGTGNFIAGPVVE